MRQWFRRFWRGFWYCHETTGQRSRLLWKSGCHWLTLQRGGNIPHRVTFVVTVVWGDVSLASRRETASISLNANTRNTAPSRRWEVESGLLACDIAFDHTSPSAVARTTEETTHYCLSRRFDRPVLRGSQNRSSKGVSTVSRKSRVPVHVFESPQLRVGWQDISSLRSETSNSRIREPMR